MSNKLNEFLESLKPIVDKACIVNNNNPSELLNILDMCERIHIFNEFEMYELSEESINNLDLEDIKLKAETLNTLFLFIKNNPKIQEIIEDTDKTKLIKCLNKVTYELYKIIYQHSKNESILDRLFYLCFLALNAVLSDKIVEMDNFISSYLAETFDNLENKEVIELLQINILHLILSLSKRIKNIDDISKIKNIIDSIDKQLSSLQDIEIKSDCLNTNNVLIITIVANIQCALKIVMSYLTTGYMEENIYPLIDSYALNAYKIAEQGNLENYKILSNMLGYGLGALCRNSIWEIAKRVPNLKRYFENCIKSSKNIIYSFLPSQRDSILEMLTMKRSIVLNMPTSAGKTLLAELYILYIFQQYTFSEDEHPTVCYIVPTNALVNQTKNKFISELQPLGYNIETVVPFCEIDEIEDEILTRKHIDILISTPEKLDILVRNNHSCIKNLKLVILDEAHNISDKERGSKFELVLSTIKQKRNDVHFLLLSPFMKNNKKLAEWLSDSEQDNVAISIEWTPTKQYVGYSYFSSSKDEAFVRYLPSPRNNIITDVIDIPLETNANTIKSQLGEKTVNSSVKNIVLLEKYYNLGKTMVLCPGSGTAQKNAMKTLEYLKSRNKLKNLLDDPIKKVEISKLIAIIELEALDDNDLIECLKYGIAYHHSKLSALVKEKIEDLITKDCINIIFATTTLAQGMNFPITTVIFDALTLGGGKNAKIIDNSSFWNIAGRAGRAYKDKEGHVIISYRNSKKYMLSTTTNYIKFDIKEVISSLTSFFEMLDDNTEINLKLLKDNPAASNFLQYLNHILNVSYHYNFDDIDSAKIRNILNNSFVYKELSFKEGFIESQEKIRKFSEKYIESLRNKRQESLKLADVFGISNISLGSMQAKIKELREEIINEYGTEALNEYINATNIILNTQNSDNLSKIVDIIARLPEMKIFMVGDGKLDSESLAKIIIGWVNGKNVRDIANDIKRGGQPINDLIGICNKFINGNMRNFVPWGLSIFQILTNDNEKNLPSYVYYGVNNKEDVILSKIGIPRFALKNVKTLLSKKYPKEKISIDNMENLKSKILSFDKQDYDIAKIDKSIYKEIVDTGL